MVTPGRRLFRTVPQSPALGFRAPSSTTSTGTLLAARHTKSASDLNQVGQSRYDPSRIAGTTPSSRASRGASPPPPISPRESTSRVNMSAFETSPASRPYTPYAPSAGVWVPAGMRSASPSSGSVPPPRQKQAAAPVWSAANRGNSAERRSPQWIASAGVFSHATTLEASPRQNNNSHLAPVGGNPGPAGSQSWGGSPRSTMLAGSASRSWSQSSHGRRESLNPWVPAQNVLQAQSVEKTHTVNIAPSNAVMPAKPDGPYEAQMVDLRTSLLQHIQSVQKEITRLQMERQRQQGDRQQSTTPVQTTISNSGLAPAAAIAVALSSPKASSRTVCTERERSGSDLSNDRWRRHPPVRQAFQGMGSTQASGLPCLTSTSDLMPSDGSDWTSSRPDISKKVAAVICIQRFWRRKAAKRKDYALAATAANRHDGSRRSTGRNFRKSEGQNGRPFVARHHAACRIQRAWKVSRWRRSFIAFSEHEIGWVGTLDWLQQNNLLYGTELADPEDVRWWMLQRQGAPLDREVDPWGCTKLRDHLNKMWYGRTVEPAVDEAHARAQAEYKYKAEYVEVQYLKAQYLESAERDQRYDQRLNELYPRTGEAMHSGREAYYQNWAPESMLATTSSLRSPASTDRPLEVRNASVTGVIGGAVGSSLTGPSNLVKVSNVASSPIRKATSLSPRRAATQWTAPEGDVTARTSKSQVFAVPHVTYQSSPPQTHRAPRASAVATLSSGVAPPAVGGSVSASLRPRSSVAAHRVQNSVSHSGRLSLTGNSNIQPQSQPLSQPQSPMVASVPRQSPASGRLSLSGSPPPSLVARTSGSNSHISRR